MSLSPTFTDEHCERIWKRLQRALRAIPRQLAPSIAAESEEVSIEKILTEALRLPQQMLDDIESRICDTCPQGAATGESNSTSESVT